MDASRLADPALALLALALSLQLAWFSVALARRGAAPHALRMAAPPFYAIWIVFWPVYADIRWLYAGLAAIALPPLLAQLAAKAPQRAGRSFWRDLRAVWTAPGAPAWMPPMFPLLASLAIAAAQANSAPEFAFGLALSAALAIPAADIADHFLPARAGLRLGFPAHPEQTLIGHLLFIALCCLLLAWGLHIWHRLPWTPVLAPVLIAALAGSAARALAPGAWSAPAAAAAMAAVLNLL